MRSILQVVRTPLEESPEPVTCGTCPISLSCAANVGGTGWTFDCCGSTGVVMADDEVAIVDCARHGFPKNSFVRRFTKCTLCSGDVVNLAVRAEAVGRETRYLPTVHARVSLSDRRALWLSKMKP